MDKNYLFAAIDLGSNSFRLLLAENHNNIIRPIHKELETVRIAEKLMPSGFIQEQPFKRAIAAISKFARILEQYSIARIRVCGTAALRQAQNSKEFTKEASRILNAEVEVVSGEEEASLSLAGVLSAAPSKQKAPSLIADVGGGSTEIISLSSEPKEGKTTTSTSKYISQSLAIGAVNITERFFSNQDYNAQSLNKLTDYLNDILCKVIKREDKPTPANKALNNTEKNYIIGSGGTATSLAALALNLSDYDEKKVQNYKFSSNSLNNLIDKLIKMSAATRNQNASLRNGRGDIIIAGALIYKTIMSLSSIDNLIVSDAGLLEGIFISCCNN